MGYYYYMVSRVWTEELWRAIITVVGRVWTEELWGGLLLLW